MSRQHAFDLFRDFFKGLPYLQVWEVKGEIIFGWDAEIGYKLLTEGDAQSFTEEAIRDERIFDLFVSSMTFALSS